MKKIIFFSATLLFFNTLSLNAQVSFPYFSNFDDANAQVGWNTYEKGATGDPYNWEYVTSQPFSAPNAIAHFFPVGGSQLTVDWFVSPRFDFSLGGNVDSLRYAFSGFGTIMAGDTIALYLLEGSKDPDSATNKTLLYSFKDTAYNNDNVWRKLKNLQIPVASSNSYFAFKYVTTNNWLDVRFDNLAISGNSIGVKENIYKSLKTKLFPNPAKDFVVLSNEEGALINLYTLDGKLLLSKWLNPEEQLDISKFKGVFFYNLQDEKQTIIGSGKLLMIP